MSCALLKAVKTFQTCGQILPHVRKAFNQQISSGVSALLINIMNSNQAWGKLYPCIQLLSHGKGNGILSASTTTASTTSGSLTLFLISNETLLSKEMFFTFTYVSHNFNLGHLVTRPNTPPEFSPISPEYLFAQDPFITLISKMGICVCAFESLFIVSISITWEFF